MTRRLSLITRMAVFVALVATFGCGGGKTPASDSGTASPQSPAAPAAPVQKAAERIAPYSYQAPVKGHFKEVNTGDFDLVDGLAFPASSSGGGAGTVVYVVSKPIASPVLAAAPCPMTAARMMTALRHAGWVEVTPDAKGRSKDFVQGMSFAGSGREQDMGSHPWSITLRPAEGRAAGSVRHRHDGAFDFDLPLSTPRQPEVSESDRFQGRRADASLPSPAPQTAVDAYATLHKAALARDFAGFLSAQGFDDRQSAAIRGLDGIDADFAAFADRFLTPGAGEISSKGPGWASVRAEGANSGGKKFANYYWFAACGDRLVLTTISENPQ